ncbi:uncharacterized [Tachysurus ichikawai]
MQKVPGAKLRRRDSALGFDTLIQKAPFRDLDGIIEVFKGGKSTNRLPEVLFFLTVLPVSLGSLSNRGCVKVSENGRIKPHGERNGIWLESGVCQLFRRNLK